MLSSIRPYNRGMNAIDENIMKLRQQERALRNEELRRFLKQADRAEDLAAALSRLKGFNVEERERAAEAV